MKLLFANFCLFYLAISVVSHEIPVLIWSSHKLADVLPPLAGHTINEEVFRNDYLRKLVCKDCQKHTLVVFLQDKLSLDDITKYGNVFSDKSNGGAFPHIKEYMESLPSLTLSSVKGPADALKKLKDMFQGRVHHLKSGQSLKDVKLTGRNLIVYNLAVTNNEITAEQIAKNDAQISKTVEELKELGIPYTAMYTANEPSVVKSDWYHGNMGRHLLATADDKSNGTLVEVSGCMLYAQEIRLKPSKNSSDELLSNKPKTDGSKCNNATGGTLKLSWTKQGELNSVVIEIEFAVSKKGGLWKIGNMSLTAKGKINGTEVNADNMPLEASFVYAPLGASYHCYPRTQILAKGNATADSASLVFKGLQIQPAAKKGRFGPANDCVGFFTIPIFSGLIVALILIAILGYGIGMIANITTQDRFDDPKGKPLNVHVPEQDK
ncbi:V-type proton ATPase subunit S1-like [Tubulanus polymorphus]|uniref:V-type proton ATPase subunit S1-like n=1 Tax=Tubulanus polymorphus TaxID=672921 RepID=UPI003DA29C82